MFNGYGGFGYQPGTNPMQPQMDRLNYMQQQYAQQSNQQMGNGGQQAIIPVASIEEVRSHPVDWSGATNYFIDNVNKRIYTKQLNLNGVPEVNTYVLDNSIINQSNTNEANGNNKEILNRVKSLEEKIKKYENMLLGGVQDDKSNANA